MNPTHMHETLINGLKWFWWKIHFRGDIWKIIDSAQTLCRLTLRRVALYKRVIMINSLFSKSKYLFRSFARKKRAIRSKKPKSKFPTLVKLETLRAWSRYVLVELKSLYKMTHFMLDLDLKIGVNPLKTWPWASSQSSVFWPFLLFSQGTCRAQIIV